MDNSEIYIKRLEHLVDILMPLYREASDLLPFIRRFKRTTKLINELKNEINNVFPPETKKKIEEPKELIQLGQSYMYVPDNQTDTFYIRSFAGKSAKVIQTGRYAWEEVRLDCLDKPNLWTYCNINVEIQTPTGGFNFWTRKNCLQPLVKTDIKKESPVKVEEVPDTAKKEINLKVGNVYIYDPPREGTLSSYYGLFSGKEALLLRIRKDKKDLQNYKSYDCDASQNPGRYMDSDCLVQINITEKKVGNLTAKASYSFWTKKDYLKNSTKKSNINKSPGVKIEEVGQKNNIIEHKYYIYAPDSDTYNNFLHHKGKEVYVLKISKASMSNPKNDSPYWNRCNCFVQIKEPKIYNFWTRKECLKNKK
jgi:hypothetical protein